MNWHIQWSRNAIKDMQKFDKPLKNRIWDSLNSMAKQPQLSDIKILKGKTGEYRLRVGDWRVRFHVDFINRTYLITHVKHRRDIYR